MMTLCNFRILVACYDDIDDYTLMLLPFLRIPDIDPNWVAIDNGYMCKLGTRVDWSFY